MAGLFAALADPTRLRLLNLIGGREVCVCYFVEILRQGQPKISRHLAYLRRAGIVEARRDGRRPMRRRLRFLLLRWRPSRMTGRWRPTAQSSIAPAARRRSW